MSDAAGDGAHDNQYTAHDNQYTASQSEVDDGSQTIQLCPANNTSSETVVVGKEVESNQTLQQRKKTNFHLTELKSFVRRVLDDLDDGFVETLLNSGPVPDGETKRTDKKNLNTETKFKYEVVIKVTKVKDESENNEADCNARIIVIEKELGIISEIFQTVGNTTNFEIEKKSEAESVGKKEDCDAELSPVYTKQLQNRLQRLQQQLQELQQLQQLKHLQQLQQLQQQLQELQEQLQELQQLKQLQEQLQQLKQLQEQLQEQLQQLKQLQEQLQEQLQQLKQLQQQLQEQLQQLKQLREQLHELKQLQEELQ